MTLTEAEKETVIQFDESGHHAVVYTASWVMASTLKRAGFHPVKRVQGGWWFELPLESLTIQGRKKTMKLG